MSSFADDSQAIRNEVPVVRQLTGSHRLLRFTVGRNHLVRSARPWRLDRYLHALMPTISRSLIQRWIARGCATVDGIAGDADQRLRPGQQVELIAPLPERDEEAPEPAALTLLYHDQWLLVADKPPGQLAHQAGRTMTGTLLNQLQDWCAGAGGDPQEVRLVNRIDRDTSGIVLVSRDARTHVALSAAMEAHDLRKEYRALCHGVPEPAAGSWLEPIGEGPGQSIARVVRADGQACHTDYQVLEARAGSAQERGYALLAVLLHSGRQHQIRVHAAHHGHALVGDWVYGQPCLELGGQALHAAVIEFPHPHLARMVRVEAPLPAALSALWARLRAGAAVTACALSEEQRSKLSAGGPAAGVRRPSWLSADEYSALRAETGE
jgi:23S rRNA pseudouridine1911/1915/1917 synthase